MPRDNRLPQEHSDVPAGTSGGAKPVTRTNHRSDQGFPLPGSNYCELSHAAFVIAIVCTIGSREITESLILGGGEGAARCLGTRREVLRRAVGRPLTGPVRKPAW
jgi:hypothetical protein